MDNFGDRPHESAVDTHQFMVINLVSFVEDDPHLVLVTVNGLNTPPELVRDVQLIGIKEQDDAVDALGEPLEDSDKIIAEINNSSFRQMISRLFYSIVLPSIDSLLFSGQDSRSVHHRDALQDGTPQSRALEAIEEGAAKLGQGPELLLVVHGQGIAGDDLLVLAVHDGVEAVGRGLRADPDPGVIALKQVPNQARLARRILADEQDHRLGIEVRLVERRRHELVKVVGLLQGQQLVLVNLFEPLPDGGIELGLIPSSLE